MRLVFQEKACELSQKVIYLITWNSRITVLALSQERRGSSFLEEFP